jgi:hypothetical protein
MIQALLGFILKIGFRGAVDKTLEFLKVRGAEGTEQERIRAQVEIATIEAAVRDYRTFADLQKTKTSYGWFWVIVAVMIAPLAFVWVTLNLYNVFWCAGCAFPQPWTIAAYPPPFDRWAQSMFDWIFGPAGGVGVGLGVGAGLMRGKRK